MTDPAQSLDSFDPHERARALRDLVAGSTAGAAGHNINMHAHSFFSYNAKGASPTRIVYEAWQQGLYAAGLCDFDVLDGLEEFYEAGRVVGLRTCVNLETRAYVSDYAEVDINSPGEHGVAYVMGAGFCSMPPEHSKQRRGLEDLRRGAQERNVALVNRIARAVPEIHIDYERDVLPLTPAGVATERHIICAWVDRVLKQHGGPTEATGFFARLLNVDASAAAELVANRVALEGTVRSRLAKRGGIAYAPPDKHTFPPLRTFVEWVLSCKAIPMTTWLDGTSEGEADADKLLEYMGAQGARALNIVPDRNWNVSDKLEREIKVSKLRQMVAAADKRELPVNIGTELNKAGLPFVDDLAGPVLRDMKTSFIRGARILVGHTVLARYCDYSYVGTQANAEFGDDTAARNRFFAAVGALEPVDEVRDAELRARGAGAALNAVQDSVREERWKI